MTRNPTSLSGALVALDGELHEFTLEELLSERRGGFDPTSNLRPIRVPAGHLLGPVSKETYEGYRAGRESFCVDVVIQTRLPTGELAVMAVKRREGIPFGGSWWMVGGAVQSYMPLADFARQRAFEECGVLPVIQGRVGYYRTCAHDYLASTTQLCYAAYAPYDELMASLKLDEDQTTTRFLTLIDLACLKSGEIHWYPRRAFERVLRTDPDYPNLGP